MVYEESVLADAIDEVFGVWQVLVSVEERCGERLKNWDSGLAAALGYMNDEWALNRTKGSAQGSLSRLFYFYCLS